MKKTIKNIIFIVLLIYTIGSFAFMIKAKKDNYNSMILYNQKLNLEGNTDYKFSTSEWEYIIRYSSRYEFSCELFELLLGATFVGTILGLIISIKESSKIKYILYFIFGNILYNSILSTIQSIIFIKLNLQSANHFINEFLYNYLNFAFSLNDFLKYLIFVIGIVIIILVNTKTKVKKLNDELKKKQNQ